MILVCPQVIPIRDGVKANSEWSFIVVGMVLETRKPQHHQRILISMVWGGTIVTMRALSRRSVSFMGDHWNLSAGGSC